MLVISASVMGCTEKTKEKEMQIKENTPEEEDAEDGLYLITANNTMDETLTLYSYQTELEYEYNYSFATRFKDKYGNFSPAVEFTAGRVVILGDRDRDGYLTTVQLSDQVWEYEKIRRFSVDEGNGVFDIAGTRYSIRDKLFVFSGEERISLTDLSEKEDVLTIVGKEKKILSIVVTTGHGTLSLSNTELFHGSFLQLNNDIFALISDDLEMELPEGIYTLKVANDGWGGTTEIEIIRGEKTEVDLDTLKGEGKKKGIVHFEIDAEGIEVYIDNQKTDYSQPVELTYGTHSLVIKGETIDTWKKYLSVNAAEATISIALDEKASSVEEDTQQEEETEEDTQEEELREKTETTEKTQ